MHFKNQTISLRYYMRVCSISDIDKNGSSESDMDFQHAVHGWKSEGIFSGEFAITVEEGEAVVPWTKI